MCGTKSIVVTFFPAGETRQPAQLTQAAHAFAPTRQNFVRIGLMAHVPDQAIFRGVKHIVQRHGELYRAQVGTQVATRF